VLIERRENNNKTASGSGGEEQRGTHLVSNMIELMLELLDKSGIAGKTSRVAPFTLSNSV